MSMDAVGAGAVEELAVAGVGVNSGEAAPAGIIAQELDNDGASLDGLLGRCHAGDGVLYLIWVDENMPDDRGAANGG